MNTFSIHTVSIVDYRKSDDINSQLNIIGLMGIYRDNKPFPCAIYSSIIYSLAAKSSKGSKMRV